MSVLDSEFINPNRQSFSVYRFRTTDIEIKIRLNIISTKRSMSDEKSQLFLV